MPEGKLRVVHYINQFFAGIGGEEKADVPLEVRKGAVGPGSALAAQLGDRAEIVATIVCGDNYFADHLEQTKDRVLEEVRKISPQVVVAGPTFNAGRYGYACIEVCNTIANQLGVPCIIAQYHENPGVELYRHFKNRKVWCLPTGDSAADMGKVIPKMAFLALKAASGQPIGPAHKEGYIDRGIRLPGMADKTGVERALDMLDAKIKGQPFRTEIPIISYDVIPPAPKVTDLTRTTLGVISTAGVVPTGNPDKFKSGNNKAYAKYPISGLRTMEAGKWIAVHGGYNTAFMHANPNLGVPLDVLREMEDAGVIGSLHSEYYAITGNGAQVTEAKRMGAEMAHSMKGAGVNAVLLVST